MRIAVVFDTPYDSWHYEDHARQMAKEVAAWKDDEPEMEYQIADALRQRGHEVTLIGVKNDLEYLVRCLDELHPELVFNAAEAFHGNASLEYMVPGLLEAEGYRYTGSPPMALLVSRNKAMSKKVLAWHGIRVPRFVTWRPGERVAPPAELPFPLIVKPLQSDASVGIAHASVVQDAEALRERVALVHERFHQPAIAEEFVDGRELYVSLLGNGDELDILPITELVFDRNQARQVERGLPRPARDPQRLRPAARPRHARPDRGDLPGRLPLPLAARLRPARRPARARRRGLGPGGEREPVHQLRARHGSRGGEGRHGLLPLHPAPGGRGDAPA